MKQKQLQDFKAKQDGLNFEHMQLQIGFAENFCKEKIEIKAFH